METVLDSYLGIQTELECQTGFVAARKMYGLGSELVNLEFGLLNWVMCANYMIVSQLSHLQESIVFCLHWCNSKNLAEITVTTKVT